MKMAVLTNLWQNKVDTTGPTTEAIDSPDAVSVKKNDSGELGDGRTDNLITEKVVEITQLQTKLEDMKPVAVDSPYMMLVGIDDLGDSSSRKFGTEGVVGK